MLRVWLLLPLYLVQTHLPSWLSSAPFDVTLCAALFTEKMAAPPNCHLVLAFIVLLCAQLTCWVSHRCFVLVGRFLSSGSILQSRLSSTMPKISNSHLVSPCQMTSSLWLPILAGKPPMFWKPTLSIVSCFNLSSSPNFPVCISPRRSPKTSNSLLLSEASSLSWLTIASSPRGTAGF